MNPYEVLGVSPTDDEETIKRAYRELAKKYHPDRYVNNPLADLAEEKMKEINKAYDMIINKKASGASSTGGTGYGQGGAYGQGAYNNQTNANPSFGNVRILINMNNISAARNMLNQLERNAEWYYLSGIINMRMGWYNQAMDDLNRAVSMDPTNVEYQQALNSIRGRNVTYNNTGRADLCDPCGFPCLCLPCFCPCDGSCCC